MTLLRHKEFAASSWYPTRDMPSTDVNPTSSAPSPTPTKHRYRGHDFGIVIGTYHRDYFMARATCASFRYFMPDVPICLLVDGDFPTDDLQKAFGAFPLYRKDIRDDYLRQVSTGYGWTKISLLWDSPFERFLYVDADTVLWGDITSKLALDRPWDLLLDDHTSYDLTEATKPMEVAEPRPWPPKPEEPLELLRDYVSRWFFDSEKLEKVYPDYDWRANVDRYFTSGVWGARRGLFSLDEYRRLRETHAANPGMFKVGEQGAINFMMFSQAARDNLDVYRIPIQTEISRITPQTIDRRYQATADGEPVAPSEGFVVHYTSFKPLLPHTSSGRAMNTFRRRAYRTIHGKDGLAREIALRREDIAYAGWKWHLKLLLGRVRVS